VGSPARLGIMKTEELVCYDRMYWAMGELLGAHLTTFDFPHQSKEAASQICRIGLEADGGGSRSELVSSAVLCAANIRKRSMISSSQSKGTGHWLTRRRT